MKAGKRTKAGRKPVPKHLKRVQENIRIPRWLRDWLRKEGNKGKLVEEALIEKNNLEPPEPG